MDELISVSNQLTRKWLILGDFIVHYHQWGSIQTESRGRQMVNLIINSNLFLLNVDNGSRVDDRTGNSTLIYHCPLYIYSTKLDGVHIKIPWEVITFKSVFLTLATLLKICLQVNLMLRKIRYLSRGVQY